MGILMNAVEQQEMREHRQRHEEAAARREREAAYRLAQIREEKSRIERKLLSITRKMFENTVSSKEIEFVLSNLDTWKIVLTRVNADLARYFIDNMTTFAQEIQCVLRSLRPLLELKSFKFMGGLITRGELERLLLTLQNTLLLPDVDIGQNNAAFMGKLRAFLENLPEETLNDTEIFCLDRIINDYQIKLFGNDTPMDNMIVNQLLATVTLSQLRPKGIISGGTAIHPRNFMTHLNHFKGQIEKLPLSRDTRETLMEVILPGLESMITDEQKIVEHVTKNYGRLYYLNEKLPLHTDHGSSANPEEYRNTLHQLLINFFGAAQIADHKGRLHLFCEKICVGYCFEGRTREVLAWVACLSDLVSFDAVMEKYIHKEYIPYATIMHQKSAVEVMDADSIINFIMMRYSDADCLPHQDYAPEGKVTAIGVKKYLYEVLSLTSEQQTQRAQQAKTDADLLIDVLEQNSASFWYLPWRTLMQIKIAALRQVVAQIEARDVVDVAIVARDIKQQYPLASAGMFGSKTGRFLDQLESYHVTSLFT